MTRIAPLVGCPNGLRAWFHYYCFWKFCIIAAMVLSSALFGHAAADDLTTCKNGSGDEALAACTRALQASRLDRTERVRVYNARGVLWKRKGDYDRAIADYNAAIELDPEYHYAYYNRGISYFERRDIDRAIADFTRVIRINPKYAQAYNNRGTAYKEKQDYDQALSDYDQAIKVNPKDASFYNNRGVAWKNKGEYDRAIADYNEAIRLNPKYAIAYSNLGNVYYSKSEYDRAIANYTEAIKLDTQPSYYYNRGDSYRRKGEFDRAIADLGQAIRLDPKYAIAYDSRGNAYYSKSEYDRAIADYTEVIRLDPQGATGPYNSRGNAYYSRGEYGLAITDYTEAIRINPKYAVAYNNRGNAYRRKAEYESAIRDFSEAIRLNPKYTLAYTNRGEVHLSKSDYGPAITDFDEAIRLDPKNVTAYNDRGFALKQEGDYARAIIDLDEAIRLNPKLAAAYASRGGVYRQKGDLDRAIADLSKAILLDPNITPAYTDRGLAYEQKGDLDLARVDFTAALERQTSKYATTELAVETARARLAALGVPIPDSAAQRPSSRPTVADGRRLALVIGNGKYPNLSADAQLANSVNDARVIKVTLEELGFKVIYGENLGRRGFVDKLFEFSSQLDKDAIAFFYFAGHGVAFSGANYLLPSDIPEPRPTAEVRAEEGRLADHSIAEAQVIERVIESGARIAIAVLDACRNNPLRSANARSLGSTRGLVRSSPAEGVFSIYSAGFGQQALDSLGPDDRNPNSVFTRVFVQKLKMPGLDLRAVATETRRGVVTLAKKIGHHQFPAYYDQINGDVYLAGLPAAAAVPPAGSLDTSPPVPPSVITQPATRD
jgi:tetratricopeptide (TPR) repeat protein